MADLLYRFTLTFSCKSPGSVSPQIEQREMFRWKQTITAKDKDSAFEAGKVMAKAFGADLMSVYLG